MSYLVVLRGKPETKRPGVCIFTSFAAETDFIKGMSELLEYSDIVAIGLDVEAAQAMCATVPAERLFNAALLQCINEDGSFSTEQFRNEIAKIEFARGEQCPQDILLKAGLYATRTPTDRRVEGNRYRSHP